MISACLVFKRTSDPRFFESNAIYDAASTICPSQRASRVIKRILILVV